MEHRLFIFNPTSEMAIANGEVAWQPNRTLQQFEKDLEMLPFIFAKNHDFIVVDELPSDEFKKELQKIKSIAPTFIRKSQIKEDPILHSLKNLSLQPWGWSPAAHHTLKNIKEFTSCIFQNSLNFNWSNTQKEIVSRKFSTSLLQSITTNNPEKPYLPVDLHPISTDSMDRIRELMQKWNQIVLKAPWSSSGRGVQMLRYAELNRSNTQWISGIIKQQGFIMVEPLLEKTEDFSLQFSISKADIQFLGIGKFNTNSNGQYISNILNPDTSFIEQIIPIKELISHIKNALEKKGIQNKYEGYAGIDLMIITNNQKKIIHPCVEVNWRYNMGLLALQLQKLIHPEAKGKFGVYFNPKQAFKFFATEMYRNHPQKCKEGLHYKGFYPLSDPEKAISGAYFILE